MRSSAIHQISRLFLLASIVSYGVAAEVASALDADSYNQWKEAGNSGEATPAERIKALPGFKVERLRSADSKDGSWVALAFDDRGRAIIFSGKPRGCCA